MESRWIRRIPLILLGSWIHVFAAADTPARMLEGKYSVENQLKVPALTPKGRYTILCEAIIKKSGRAEDPLCHVEASTRTFGLVAATSRALHYAHFAPASRQGAPIDAYMVLMARIDVTDRDPLILVVPNNGAEQRRYGLLYTAPQHVNEFYDDYSTVSTKPMSVWMTMYVDENGKVSNGELIYPLNMSAEHLQHIKESMMRMDFIPGHVDGKPVAMWHMEPVIWYWPY
jgi:hypothetical protein